MVTKIKLVSAEEIMNETGVTIILFRRYLEHGLKVTYSSFSHEDLWASREELNKRLTGSRWEIGMTRSYFDVNDDGETMYHENVYYLFNKLPGNKLLFKRLLKKKYPALYIELIKEELGV